MRATPVLLSILALASFSARAADLRPLTVRVFAYAHVPATTLRALITNGEEIFREAGFETHWVTCTPSRGDCADLLDGELLLKVVERSWRDGPQPSVFGTVLRDAHTAYFGWIFYKPVEAAARANQTSPSVLLAHVIAHEIAHLLGLVHTERGIMHCQFSPAEIQASETGGLHFSAEEAAQLRAAITAHQNPSFASRSFLPNPLP
jgi:hypothetical protein